MEEVSFQSVEGKGSDVIGRHAISTGQTRGEVWMLEARITPFDACPIPKNKKGVPNLTILCQGGKTVEVEGGFWHRQLEGQFFGRSSLREGPLSFNWHKLDCSIVQEFILIAYGLNPAVINGRQLDKILGCAALLHDKVSHSHFYYVLQPVFEKIKMACLVDQLLATDELSCEVLRNYVAAFKKFTLIIRDSDSPYAKICRATSLAAEGEFDKAVSIVKPKHSCKERRSTAARWTYAALLDRSTSTNSKWVFWLKDAASFGYAPARMHLAHYQCSIGKNMQAGRNMSFAASQGLPEAHRHLANYYLKGVGIESDNAKALEWLELAANLGDTQACVGLGMCYFPASIDSTDSETDPKFQLALAIRQAVLKSKGKSSGLGVTVNSAEADKWFRRAADYYSLTVIPQMVATKKIDDFIGHLWIEEGPILDTQILNAPNLPKYLSFLTIERSKGESESWVEWINKLFSRLPKGLKKLAIIGELDRDPGLANRGLISLVEHYSQLTSLDLAGDTQLTSLDLSGCTQLTSLHLTWRKQLTSVNLSGCTQLISVDLAWCEQLTSVNLSGCTQLTSLHLTWCERLTSLNLSGCDKLSDKAYVREKLPNVRL